MTTKAERERVLQGQVPIAASIIGYLLEKGWSVDRILKNIAQKKYPPHHATIRVEFESEYMRYWVRGEYRSMGRNILSTCIACIKAASSLAEIAAAMDCFLNDVEQEVNQSFAVRFLGSTT